MTKQEPRAHRRDHRDRQIEEVVHDPYQARVKPPEPAACPKCGIVFHEGIWRRGWDSNPRAGSPRPSDFESAPL